MYKDNPEIMKIWDAMRSEQKQYIYSVSSHPLTYLCLIISDMPVAVICQKWDKAYQDS